MTKVYGPHTAYNIVDDILNECFTSDLEEIFLKTGIQLHENIMYKGVVIDYRGSFKRASAVGLNTEALDEYVELKKLYQSCRHMLRKLHLAMPTVKDFVQAVPLADHEFKDSRSYDIYSEYSSNPYYLELEVRLLTSRVLK